jgi:hypothetical protein
MRPGFVAATGYDAAEPLLLEVSTLLGPFAFFENFVTITIIMFAWVVVLLAFFILAIQLFITILEFKLTTLAGFILVPFALWNKTSFLAERVLGNVMAAGIKLMVLAVIVGIGGGIYLVPLIIVLGLGTVKEAAACGAVFIWINSLSGLLSRLQFNFIDLSPYAPLLIVVIAGGILGSLMGASRLNGAIMEKLLGGIVVVAVLLLGRSLFFSRHILF